MVGATLSPPPKRGFSFFNRKSVLPDVVSLEPEQSIEAQPLAPETTPKDPEPSSSSPTLPVRTRTSLLSKFTPKVQPLPEAQSEGSEDSVSVEPRISEQQHPPPPSDPTPQTSPTASPKIHTKLQTHHSNPCVTSASDIQPFENTTPDLDPAPFPTSAGGDRITESSPSPTLTQQPPHKPSLFKRLSSKHITQPPTIPNPALVTSNPIPDTFKNDTSTPTEPPQLSSNVNQSIISTTSGPDFPALKIKPTKPRGTKIQNEESEILKEDESVFNGDDVFMKKDIEMDNESEPFEAQPTKLDNDESKPLETQPSINKFKQLEKKDSTSDKNEPKLLEKQPSKLDKNESKPFLKQPSKVDKNDSKPLEIRASKLDKNESKPLKKQNSKQDHKESATQNLVLNTTSIPSNSLSTSTKTDKEKTKVKDLMPSTKQKQQSAFQEKPISEFKSSKKPTPDPGNGLPNGVTAEIEKLAEKSKPQNPEKEQERARVPEPKKDKDKVKNSDTEKTTSSKHITAPKLKSSLVARNDGEKTPPSLAKMYPPGNPMQTLVREESAGNELDPKDVLIFHRAVASNVPDLADDSEDTDEHEPFFEPSDLYHQNDRTSLVSRPYSYLDGQRGQNHPSRLVTVGTQTEESTFRSLQVSRVPIRNESNQAAHSINRFMELKARQATKNANQSAFAPQHAAQPKLKFDTQWNPGPALEVNSGQQDYQHQPNQDQVDSGIYDSGQQTRVQKLEQRKKGIRPSQINTQPSRTQLQSNTFKLPPPQSHGYPQQTAYPPPQQQQQQQQQIPYGYPQPPSHILYQQTHTQQQHHLHHQTQLQTQLQTQPKLPQPMIRAGGGFQPPNKSNNYANFHTKRVTSYISNSAYPKSAYGLPLPPKPH